MRTRDFPYQKPIHVPHWTLHYSAFHVAIGRNPMSASPPPSLPRAFLHSLHPHHPSLPSAPSLSPPGPLYTRLSNGSHSAPSPTNSRSSFHGVSFLLQIGLTRETVNLEASDLSLSSVKDLVCSIVDQKVRMSLHLTHDSHSVLVTWDIPHSTLFSNAPWSERFSTNTCVPTTFLLSNWSSHSEGSRGPTPCNNMCFVILSHIHLFRFLFSKADIWALCPKMSQTPQKHAHNSSDAPSVTAHSAAVPVIYIVV